MREEPEVLTGLMLVAALVSGVAGLLYGYATGVISGAPLQMTEEFGIGNGMEQVIAAAILLEAVLGALTCSVLSERLGRKKTILTTNGFFTSTALRVSVGPGLTYLLMRVAIVHKVMRRRRPADFDRSSSHESSDQAPARQGARSVP